MFHSFREDKATNGLKASDPEPALELNLFELNDEVEFSDTIAGCAVWFGVLFFASITLAVIIGMILGLFNII